MKVEMVIETEGATTTVSREYESDFLDTTPVGSFEATHVEMPVLADVTQAVATAAVIAHRITPKE